MLISQAELIPRQDQLCRGVQPSERSALIIYGKGGKQHSGRRRWGEKELVLSVVEWVEPTKTNQKKKNAGIGVLET